MAIDKNTSSGQSSILDKWFNRKKIPKENTGITRIPQGVPVPLSKAQQGLWFLQQLYPENPFYHYSEKYLFHGSMQEDHLIGAIRHVVGRHDILRTAFHLFDKQVIQKATNEPQIEKSRYDLCTFTASDQASETKKIIIQEGRRPFKLNEGPLLRVTLIRLAKEEYLMLLTLHHLITDKWSMKIFRDEMAAVYRKYISGQSTDSQSLPVQFADYSHWQIAQQGNPEHLAYWKNKLAGNLTILDLPTDNPRPVRPSFNGKFKAASLSVELSQKLKAICKQAGTTSFVLFLSMFKVLLYRYTGEIDLLIGTPVSNRRHVVLEKLIGYFTDTIVLRSNASLDPTFLEFMEQVRLTVLEAFSHGNVTFDSLVQALKPGRQEGVNPLFQVMFVYHKEEPAPDFGPDLSCEHKPFDLGVSKFDLTLYISEDEDQFNIIFEYASDLFLPATIDRMMGHFSQLLASMVQNPEQHISAFPMLSDFERNQILTTWNDTRATHSGANGIHHLIERIALEHPDKIAIAHQGIELSYGQLNEMADALSADLLETGVESSEALGLFVEPSLEMILGMFAILKTGYAYVPLDPELPADRIQFMLVDSGIKTVLTQRDIADQLPDTISNIVSIDISPREKNFLRRTDQIEWSDQNLAYIIYTSGSTGLPKGVAVSHQNIINSTEARFQYYPHQPDSFLLMSSFAFDSSMVGIFWTLCSGGKLVIPERHIEQDMQRLSGIFSSHRVTHTLMLPSLYSILLENAKAEQLKFLQTIIVAGEECGSTVCQRHFTILPDALLYNEYGPTEATVWSTVHQITTSDIGQGIPIGRPVANTQAYVLDHNHRPVPVGIRGELYVGGAGVARGYINQPGLTSEVFIPDPFSGNPDGRLYRTGDLAKYREDGVIEFLGRADHQVKIRGHRIELDEINEIIKQCPLVQDAVVVLQYESSKKSDESERPEEIERLTLAIASMEENEADILLRFVENQSEAELDYILNNMRERI